MNNSFSRQDLRALHGIFLVLTIIIFSSCRNDITEIRAITEFQNLPAQTNMHAEYIYTEKGKIRNKIIATQIDQYADEKHTTIAHGGFRLFFFDSLEQEQAELSAEKGTFNQEDRNLVAEGNVRLTNTKGEKLETEQLIFDQDSARIYTDQFVKISTKNGDIFGEGLESNESFTRYRILRPTGDLNVNDDDTTSTKNPD